MYKMGSPNSFGLDSGTLKVINVFPQKRFHGQKCLGTLSASRRVPGHIKGSDKAYGRGTRIHCVEPSRGQVHFDSFSLASSLGGRTKTWQG